MKIAILSCFYPYRGGISQFNACLYGELSKNHVVKAFNFSRQYPEFLFPGKTQFVTADDEAVPVESESLLDTANPFTYISTYRAIRDWKPDVLIVRYWMSYFAPSLGYICRRMKKHCKVISILDNVVPHEPRFFDTPLTKYFLTGSIGNVTLCEAVSEDLLRIDPKADFTVIQHPLYSHFGEKKDRKEAEKKLGLKPGMKNILFFGLIRKYKGLDILLEAFGKLSDEYQLIIAGEPYGSFAPYQEIIDRLPGKDRVFKNLKYIKDSEVTDYFSAADLAVLPYRSATQSGISSVSYHFDVPMIVTDVGGLKETIGDRGTGLVVPEGTPESIQKEIEKYFQNPSIAESCIRNIQSEKERLSWKGFAERLIDYIEKFNDKNMKGFVNYIYKVLLTAVIGIAAANGVNAQEYVNTPVEISKEKVKVDGKVCYSHVVLEKQTMFSICKAYEVTPEDIYQYNPALKETGLKKNSIIIIPSKEVVKTAQLQEAPVNVTAAKTEATPKSQKKSKDTRVHIAKWYEDLDVIAEQYGVSADEIIKANNLKGRKLSKRQKLIIPYPGEAAAQTPEDSTAVKPETKPEAEFVSADTTDVSETQVVDTKLDSKIDATLILPLTNAEGEPNRNNMDFYSGVLLAVYDLSEEGVNCNLNVFDLMDKSAQFSTDIIKGSDVVIGPVSAGDLTKIFYSAPGSKAIISPLDPRAERLVKEHPEMIHVPTPHVSQYKDLVKWMEEDFREGDKIVMITEKGTRQSNITNPVKEALDSSSLAYSPFSYSILEGRDVTEPLTELMSTAGANRIIVASESEAFVNDVVRNLNLLIFNNLDIVLYAPSKVRGFETIEVENLHNTTMHVSLGYHIDYESPEVKAFLKKFRALYNTEPTQFAFQGYDIARYFMELSAKYGENWKEHLCDSSKEMLQSTFRFVKQGTGGYTNNGVRRIIYDKGYNIKRGHL